MTSPRPIWTPEDARQLAELAAQHTPERGIPDPPPPAAWPLWWLMPVLIFVGIVGPGLAIVWPVR